MKDVFFRIAFLLLLVFLQLSFFNILFPWFRAPLFLLGVVISFVLIRNFPSALFMTLPLTLLFDTVSLGRVSWFSLYAVFFAYVTSFLLRRLLLEHKGVGLVLYGLVAFGAALLYQSLFSLVVYRFIAPETSLLLRAAPSVDTLLFSLIVFLPVFLLTHYTIDRFERYLNFLNQKQFRNIR